MKNRIKHINSLVIDFNRLSKSALEAYAKDFKTLDCEWSDHLPISHFSDEFIKMVALAHDVNPSEFNHLQSIF